MNSTNRKISRSQSYAAVSAARRMVKRYKYESYDKIYRRGKLPVCVGQTAGTGIEPVPGNRPEKHYPDHRL